MSDPRLNLPSASGFSLLIACPGKQQLQNSLPPDALVTDDPGDNETASFGNAVHDARKTGNILNLDEPQHTAYQNGIAIEAALMQKWMADKGLTAAKEIPAMSQRLWLNDPATLEPICSGEPDVVYINPPHAIVVDWKSLGGWRWSPPARRNWQLKVYALLIWKEYDGITDIRVALDRCNDKRTTTDYADYTLSDLEHAEQSVQFHAWETRQEGAARRAGEHCRYCPCRAACPEAAAYSLLPCASIGKAKALTWDSIPELVAALSDKDLVKLWQSKVIVEKILESVVARLKSMTDEELKKLGLDRGKGRDRSEIINGLAVYLHLRNNHFWTEEELWSCLDFVLGRMGEVAQRHNQGWSKKDGVDWVKKELVQWIQINPSDRPIVEL